MGDELGFNKGNKSIRMPDIDTTFYPIIIQIIIILVMDNCPFNSSSNTKLPPLSSFALPMPTAFSLVNKFRDKKEGEELKKLQIERLEPNNSPKQLTTQKDSQEISKSLTINKEIKDPEVLSKGSGNNEKKTEGRWTDEEHNKFLEGNLLYY